MNEYELKSLPDMDFVSAQKEPAIKQLDFHPEPAEKSSILERSALLVQSLKNLGIACGSMSQAKKLLADTPVERLEGDLLTYRFEPEPELVKEPSTLNAPVAHSEWGTAGIGSSDDDEEEQELEKPFEDVETEPLTDVDESFFVGADKEAPVEDAQTTNVLVTESSVEDEPHIETVAVAVQAPEIITDELTVPGVSEDEPVYESFIPAPDIEVPAHVEAEFKDVLPFLAPSPAVSEESVDEVQAVLTAIEVFDAAVFGPKPLPKPVPTPLDRQLRLAEKDSVSPVKLEFMTDEAYARFHSLETRELNFRRLAYKGLKESAELTEGLKASIEALNYPAIEKFLKLLNRSMNHKRLSEDMEMTLREVMRRSQKRWGK
ncbi:hypothetical protein [Pseudomonas amygdali]|uniref:hypothetical protein n=1 Tax=Pseudomonas amygdali TaxID=47877 RepID=UPI000EFF7D57|nr:hypothetical protein [Pseudomonas amygdali]RMV80702.1 hypothetical protein ALP04_04130 [Pseudomonas amygdali pv. sesami]